MEKGFYHKNPSIAASKLFPPHWHYKPWDLTKSQSYYAVILEITNSVKFKHFKIHSTNSELTYSTCIINKIIHPSDWGNPYINPSFSQHTSAKITSIMVHILTGITNKPGSMHFSSKTLITATPGFFTSITP